MDGYKVQILNAKQVLSLMRDTQPTIYRNLIKDIKNIVEPARSRLELHAPKVAPLSGFTSHDGRTKWGPVKATTTVTPSARGFMGNTEARLVQLVVTGNDGVGFDIADMAGRGSGKGRRPSARSRAINRNGREWSYEKNGQGEAMIRNLALKPSRYVYPTVERMLPGITAGVLASMESSAAQINQRLAVIK